jgi:hypothetical protein
MRCFSAVNEGTKTLALRGSSLVKIHYEKGSLHLIADEGPSLVYLLRRTCPGCPD